MKTRAVTYDAGTVYGTRPDQAAGPVANGGYFDASG